jgi:hypothetical protein
MSTSFRFDQLPSNVLSLSGYEFFQFIKNTLGEPEAHLLSKISVKTASSLLLVGDPLEIFNQDIDDDELDRLKEQLCFKTKNDRFLIKPGVLSGFQFLKDALKNKVDAQMKQPKKKHQLQTQHANTVASISSFLVPISSNASSSLSTSEHEKHVLRLIEKWCDENKMNFELEEFELQPGIDFFLTIGLDENSILSGSIKCKCGKSILLGKNDDKLQLSNYYKHLHSVGCSFIREVKKTAKQNKLAEQQRQQRTETLVPDTASSQSHSSLFDAPTRQSTTEPVTTNSSSSSARPSDNGKRRAPTDSQQCPPSKRNRR